MGKSDSSSMTFWTIEEYEQFIAVFDKEDKYYLLFEILFWTGMREGELLALTKGDIDFANNKIRINKTYYRANGEDVITTPKTEQSIRTIDIPNFLKNEIKEYCDRKYAFPDDERLFPIGAEAVQHKMKRMIEKAGVPKIRVHDIRHSHVCLSKGYFKNCVRNAYFTGVSAVAYAPFSIVVSVVVASRAAFSFAIRSFSALRRL